MTILKIMSMFIFYSSIFSAHAETHKLRDGLIKWKDPKGWQKAEGLYGVQLMFLAPPMDKRRVVITVDSTPLDHKLDSKALAYDEKSYQLGRKRWLQEKGGIVQEFTPYSFVKLKNAEMHSLGHKYELKGEFFEETSHYISCQRSLFHVKVLYPGYSRIASKAEVEETLKSFECDTWGPR